jgi:hypothetical protein
VAPSLELNFPNPVETRADLFDRTDELRLLQETLLSPARRAAVIMGERVTGKTSLLNVVVEWASREAGFKVLQLPHASTREALAEEMLEGMAAQMRTSLRRLGLREADGQFRLATVSEFSRKALTVSGQAVGVRFLVCLEELDSLLVKCSDGVAEQILDFLLHVVATPGLPVKFVCTMSRTAPHILRSDASPFLSAARIAVLAPWTFELARPFVDELLGDGLVLDDAAHRLLFAMGGGHPYLTKAILQSLHELYRHAPAGAVLGAADVRAATAATVASPEVDFTLDNVVRVHFTDAERAVLVGTADSGAAAAGSLSGPLERWPLPAQAAVRDLRSRHYLHLGSRNRPEHRFGVLAEWLRSSTGFGSAGFGSPVDDGPEGPPVLTLDPNRGRVFVADREIDLTAAEYRLLLCLAKNAGRVVDRSTIAREVWSDREDYGGVGRLDALVHRLRDALGPEASRLVETRRGRGFYLGVEAVQLLHGRAT